MQWFFTVAAQQEAKRKKLEGDTQNTKDSESRTLLSDDSKPDDCLTHDSAVAEDDKPEFSYKLPPLLEGVANLPPSVMPPSAAAFIGPLPEWG